METYCGKICDNCIYKEKLPCNGCLSGPGSVSNGDCKLARCCREKGHETCETCELKRNCGTWLDRVSMPRQRIESRIQEQERQEVLKRRAPFMARWLTVLFWLMLPRFIGSFLAGGSEITTMSNHQWMGEALQLLCLLIQVVILLCLSKEHKGYRKAGILGLLDVALWVAVIVWEIFGLSFDGILIITEVVVMLLSAKNEYRAHADMILPIDGKMSEQWDILWKWRLYSTVAFTVSLFLVGMNLLLGLLLALAAVIGMAVTTAKNLICLRRTARLFQKVAEEGRIEDGNILWKKL